MQVSASSESGMAATVVVGARFARTGVVTVMDALDGHIAL
jgi:hypothetical protein